MYADPNSKNKYHKKGFKGHTVNPHKLPESIYPAHFTNKDKMTARRMVRERRQAMIKEANNEKTS